MKGDLFGTLPIQASKVAAQWDNLYIFLFWVSVFFCVIVIAPMVFFAIKYRERPGLKPKFFEHNTPLEIAWTAIPTVLLMVIFVWGWIVYRDMFTPGQDAEEINVVAQSWEWNFQYEDGRVTKNQLFVPVGKPVTLKITSKINDVLHSFFIPNLRIKVDAVPGMYTYLHFTVDIPGQHQVFCAEYCGFNHSGMLAKLIALPPEQWKLFKWGKELKPEDYPPPIGLGSLSAKKLPTQTAKIEKRIRPVEHGRLLSNSRGCMACHSSDGSSKVGPTYQGLYGSEVVLADGSKVLVDDNYLRESIERPQAKIVKGFEKTVMPTYEGQLRTEEVNALISYIKSLKN